MSVLPSIPSAAVVLPGLVPAAPAVADVAPAQGSDFAALLAPPPIVATPVVQPTAPLNPPPVPFHLASAHPDLPEAEPAEIVPDFPETVPDVDAPTETPDAMIPLELLAQAVSAPALPLPAAPAQVRPSPAVVRHQERVGEESVADNLLQTAVPPARVSGFAVSRGSEHDFRPRLTESREIPQPVAPAQTVASVQAPSAPAVTSSSQAPVLPGTPVEKTAAVPLTPRSEVSAPANDATNNKFLVVAGSSDANAKAPHGIAPANQPADMRNDLPNTARPRGFSVLVTPSPKAKSVSTSAGNVELELRDRAPASSSPAPAHPVSPAQPTTHASGFPAPVAESHSPSARMVLPSPVREEPSASAAEAAGVVREVVELTHAFRDRERSSVEVDFSFKDNTRLSVRVALRDGAVHTTFRTESETLRAALSREWQARVNDPSVRDAGVRLAEAVFTGASSLASTAAAPASVAGPSADTSRHHTPGNPADASRFDTSAFGGGDAREHAHSSHAQSDSSAHHRGAASSARAFSSPAHGAAATISASESAARPAHDRAFQAFA